MSSSTSTSTVHKNGKVVITKTVTVTGADGVSKTETFVEEREENSAGSGLSIFESRMKEFENKHKDRTADFKDASSSGSGEGSTAGEETDEETARCEEEAGDEKFTRFQRECLASHNLFRARHGAVALELSTKLCGVAQDWAEHLVAAARLEHRPASNLGENIFSSWSSQARSPAGGEAVDSWYSEIKQFKFGVEAVAGGTGHFSQVVWAASTKLGVGLATNRGKVVVVCNYDPPGNFRGRYKENVLPPAL